MTAADQVNAAATFITEALQLMGQSASESVLRHNLTGHLPLMFPHRPWWVSYHTSGSEAQVKYRDESIKRLAFVDTLVGRTTIEYESDLSRPEKFKAGHFQVRQHCAGLLNAGQPADQIYGILSDTLRWRVYKIAAADDDVADGQYSPEDIQLEPIQELDLTGAPDDAERLLDFLPRYLGREQTRPLAASTIASDLGFESPFCKTRIQDVSQFVEHALDANPEYAELIKKLWVDFVDYLGAPVGEQTFDQAVYVDELYLVTLAKLLCANVIARQSLISNEQELVSILDGAFFKDHGLVNLVEYDYFGWLNTSPQVDGLLPVASAIQKDLRAYDFNSPVGEDLFGQVMAQLAKRSQRLLLGQEWTPAWLARLVVERLDARLLEQRPNTSPSYLDMCSGSGALVVQVVLRALKRATDEGKTGNDLVDVLVNAVTGFDIDPLAVMLAKVNWVVAARDVLGDGVQISVPIYHADSLFNVNPLAPGGESGAGDQTLEFPGAEASLGNVQITLPGFLITPEHRRLFDNITSAIYDLAMAAAAGPADGVTQQDLELLVEQAAVDTATTLTTEDEARLLEFVVSLAATLEALQRTGRNGIWAFVLRNSYRPALIAGQFDAIATNPPWLSLSKIADNPYRDRLRRLSAEFSVRPPGASHPHTELSTLFLLHSVDRYLRDGGQVACLLPDAVRNGYQHTPFRRGAYKTATRAVQFTPDEVWQIQHETFKNESIVLFGSKAAAAAGEMAGYAAARDGLESTPVSTVERGEFVAWTFGSSGGAEGWFDGKGLAQGADLMPRTLVFHELTPAGRGRYNVTAIDRSASSSRYLLLGPKKHKDFKVNGGTVLERFVYPMLLSSHLNPFQILDPALGLMPASRTARGFTAASPTQLAASGSKPVFDKILTRFGGSAADFLQSIDTNRGKLSAQTRLGQAATDDPNAYLLVTGAGGSFPCAAFRRLSELQPSRLIIDQTLYWTVLTGPHAEANALYLAGMINSEACNDLIEAFQPRGVAGRRHVHTLAPRATPTFDPEDPAQQDVVSATRDLLSAYGKIQQPAKFRDVNFNMKTRRKRIRDALRKLPEYAAYESACRAVYGLNVPDADGLSDPEAGPDAAGSIDSE